MMPVKTMKGVPSPHSHSVGARVGQAVGACPFGEVEGEYYPDYEEWER